MSNETKLQSTKNYNLLGSSVTSNLGRTDGGLASQRVASGFDDTSFSFVSAYTNGNGTAPPMLAIVVIFSAAILPIMLAVRLFKRHVQRGYKQDQSQSTVRGNMKAI